MLRRICTILKKDRSLLQQTARFSTTTNNGAADTSRYGVVMSFGDGNHGALGLPPSLTGIGADVYEPTVIPGFPSDITSVAAGHYHSLASHLSWRSMGMGPQRRSSTWPRRSCPQVSFGWGHALAKTVDGKLYGWGYSADGRIGEIGGFVEASVLDSAGAANSQGGNQFEAAERRVLEGMAKEKDMPIVWEPCLVEELDETRVVDIACGLDHSLVLCSDGKLLTSGSNIYGQLGRENQAMGFFPAGLALHTSHIASGLGHSLAICNSSGRSPILSWGWNGSSQLGRTGNEKRPSEVEGISEERAISVSAGRVHSLAVTCEGQLWVWGCGKNGRLGLGSPYDEQEPILVDSLEGCKVMQAVAGFDHNLVLVAQ